MTMIAMEMVMRPADPDVNKMSALWPKPVALFVPSGDHCASSMARSRKQSKLLSSVLS